MFYRESGQFKTSYAADQAIFPIKQDNWGMVLLLLLAFFAVPYFGTEYFFQSHNDTGSHIRFGSNRTEYSNWILWSIVFGNGRVYGGRGSSLLQVNNWIP